MLPVYGMAASALFFFVFLVWYLATSEKERLNAGSESTLIAPQLPGGVGGPGGHALVKAGVGNAIGGKGGRGGPPGAGTGGAGGGNRIS